MRVLAGLPESGVLCFVTEFTQKYLCLCQLILERVYNYVSVFVLYCVLVMLCFILPISVSIVFISFELL